MESEFTVESAAQFGKIAEAVAEIVQRGIEALQRLAEAFGSMLDPICRAVDRFLVRLWAECRSLPVALPQTRYAMRARKMRRYRQTFR